MFAVIEDRTRQYRVQQGDVVQIDYREGVAAGDKISFDRVLLANGGAESSVGRPAIDGAIVECEVVAPLEKGKKLEIQKFRRRKNSRRHTGHRQKYTSVRITAINVPGLKVAKESAEK
jgi:large subunit ribosomal protein L21